PGIGTVNALRAVRDVFSASFLPFFPPGPCLASTPAIVLRSVRVQCRSPASRKESTVSTQNMMPPMELNFVGGGPFDAIGQHCLQQFVEVGGLKPHHRVLDIGCGIGRMAIPMTQYLSPQGSYEGFDIVDIGIDWCKAHITTQYPNFRFQMAD